MFKKDITKKFEDIKNLEVGIWPYDFTRKSYRVEPLFFRDFIRQILPEQDLSKLTIEELYSKVISAKEDMSEGINQQSYRFRILQKEERERIEKMYTYQALANTLDIIYKNLLNNKKRKGIKRIR